MFRQPHFAVRFACVAAVTCATRIAFPAQDQAAALVRSAAPDWPHWRGPRRDGVSNETGLLPSWPAGGPERLWKTPGIGKGYSSPIVVDGTIYMTGDRGDDLVISALSADGSLRWQSTNGAAWQRSHPGARASCTYDECRLYHMNAHGRLACLDASTGSERWAVDVLQRFEARNITWGISESVLVDGDRVFVTPAGAKALVAALDKRTGDTLWATPPLDGEQASYASPILVALGERRLLVNGAARHAFAVDVEGGRLCWHTRHLDPKNTIVSTPILCAERFVFTNSSREYGGIYGVRSGDLSGDRAWSADLKVGHGGMVGLDGRLVGASSRGAARGWVSVDAGTGASTHVGAHARGSVIYADNRFYCLTERGTMTLQEMTTDGFATRGSFQFADGKDVWAHPVICQGRLFLRYHDTLSCYDIRRR